MLWDIFPLVPFLPQRHKNTKTYYSYLLENQLLVKFGVLVS
jgi:hypothetical protein